MSTQTRESKGSKTSQSASRGGTHEQHVAAGRQSHRNDDRGTTEERKISSQAVSRGGTHEQHVEAGRQSHKNDSKSSQSPNRIMGKVSRGDTDE